MKVPRVLLIVFSIILFSCRGDPAKKNGAEEESYKLIRQSLLNKEIKSPRNFLSVGGRDKRNIVGQTVVKGTISNKATVAVFKDVTIKLSFYS